MLLTDTACKNSKPSEKPRKLSDTAALYLEVMPSGSKYWRFKYLYAGKEKRLAFGVYPEVSLKEAREKCDEARRLISDGVDPSQIKKQEKLKRHILSTNSFESVACEWHAHRKPGWTERHANYVLKRLAADLFNVIGFRPIQEVTAPELLSALRTIEERGATDIASDLRGALKIHKKENYARLEEKELPKFFLKLEEYDGDYQTKLAFKFGSRLFSEL